ncbi:uncharacterized protein SPAPADRAFT_139631 [Spathaspora passalidarum NRRL Y-27907]|uniref:ATPase n=1 Tax=Spathaspora passalidarum (strain NRRL Y-27907 / 11-Y1) TaxID=619300 RepID=G3APU8_SPAPN|nr:uncharacterized protein SPAPADRAFT_139631 [Spathaspora passalidarum NRRL Y-27907]EGW32269.1 hypothetical protein SPAPADRAFT_139631 [Spathaspora passalidarum NRRL Y-27907]
MSFRVRIRGLRFYSKYTSGNQGVEGRLPQIHVPESGSVGLAITDPYIIYQNYIHNGILQKDESQLRVMKEFQKLYHRVVDYTPPEELSINLSLLIRKIQLKHAKHEARAQGFSPLKYTAIRNLFSNVDTDKKALMKYMSDEDHLHTFASPQGLLVNGGVGSGKSMLMDIFAASLPHKSKMRWHYNNFILWVFSEMHQIQQERMLTSTMGNGKSLQCYTMENEFILYEIAQKMINKNTILILDEFVLPDIAAANIVKILFTYYFKLGGVLVATSNKLPEDLYSNSFHRKNFTGFLSILNSRCHSVDINSEKDYRSYFAANSTTQPNLIVKRGNAQHNTQWIELVKQATGSSSDTSSVGELGGRPSTITVYNRKINIPLTFNDTTAYLDFAEICQGLHSSSDYITIASHYKTIILDNVPIMTASKKNEARRFITLLDAIYESKCQLFIRCEVDIDHLFFPDVLHQDNTELMEYLRENYKEVTSNLQVQDEEMFARTSIDMMNPYRPNVSTYDHDHTKSYDDYEQVNQKNYKNLKAFTGDDEKFAFKRAVSRIKEMVNSDAWRRFDRWIPLDNTMRPWETTSGSTDRMATSPEEANYRVDRFLEDHPIKELTKNELLDTFPRDLSARNGLPFRQFNAKVAPMFKSLQHFWAMGIWTKEQGERAKDGIAKSWISSSIRK